MWTRIIPGFFILFALPLVSQEQSYSISGVVVNSITGEPLKEALVQVGSHKGRALEPALTDASGAFRFAQLASGTYSITATKPGFGEAAESVTATVGPSRDNITVRLRPLAVIKGRVVDSYGDPVSGVLVQALQPRMEDGRRKMQMRVWARSNDRGDYRLAELAAGRYYVKVAGRGGGTMLYVGEVRPALSDEAFAPVYYGGGRSAADAIPLTAEPGVELQADFTLALQPGHNIVGAVINAAPYRPLKIDLLSGDEDAGATPAIANAADGRFRIQNVVDGTYKLIVSQGEGADRTRAVERIDVAGRDFTGLIVRLSAGATLTGSMRVEGELPPGSRMYSMVQLTALDATSSERDSGHSANVDSDGKFEIPHVLPGRYRVRLNTAAGYVASISTGDKALGDHELTVTDMETPAPLEIVVRTDAGEVTGTVVIDGRPATAIVTLVPTSGPSDDNLVSYASNGSFVFPKVPPGEYRAYATKAGTEDSEVTSATGGGERVDVVPNGKHKVELTRLTEAAQ